MVKRQGQGDRCGNRAADGEAAEHKERNARRHGGEKCRHRIDPPGQRANRYVGEAKRHDHIERIAGWMRGAQHAADILELRGIPSAAEAGEKSPEVDGERRKRGESGE